MTTDNPEYKVSLSEGDIEVRDYPIVAVAEVIVSGDRKSAGNAGFRLLASYIFGGNAGRRRLSMTAPVVVSPNDGQDVTGPASGNTKMNSWLVRFIMPAGQLLDKLPKPDNSQVHLRNAPASRVATLRFSGFTSESTINRKTEELQTFLAAHHLRAAGHSYLARYNPPWTLWFMRRNEVMIPVE